ncbi:hypothetical protein K469DRAFT_708419 [Zopfia rhizophila CBS 207.26]|uniref:Uncharacterized protein n=1 Tax=Zopfia rhizophila CBS 207.26 TaxID=1314779 RepID=A0A6A6E5H5_9PEZI|nr:hypothetical protein K469DRAFT_708419 [Zopfia rhizophila CBS 207.26]
MNRIGIINSAIRTRPFTAAKIGVIRRRYSSQPSPPSSPESQSNGGQPGTRAGTFYKSFGSPILKTFLGALFTYQVLYWGWLKLESVEIKKEKEEEIDMLEAKLRGLVREKDGKK